MKTTYKIVLLIATVASFWSCNDWLEASSNNKIPAGQLFETREGFEEALTGVYINMGSESLYRACVTWMGNDLTAVPYVKSLNVSLAMWQSHTYTSTSMKKLLRSTWRQYYNVIANINLILRELETHRNVIVSESEYNLIKGELLALRAYLHFDLMRLFGVADWNGENAAKLTVPYVTEYSSKITPQRSYADTEQLLFADLNAAIQALKESDPLLLTGDKLTDFNNTVNLDGYWSNRNKHLNYYATLALAARIYQWKNDTATAATYAQQVIDGALGKMVTWVDVDAQQIAATDDEKDWSFSTEHLFSLEITNLYYSASQYLFDLSGIRYGICLSREVVDNLLFIRYDPATGSQAGAEDLRGPAMQLRYGALGYCCYKLYNSSSYPYSFRNRMPMIKIAEMYYILTENYISLNQNTTALQMLDVVRKNRGVGNDFPVTADAETELMKEYYREFLCEGQLFYYMKHKKVEHSLYSLFDVNYKNLIYPYPDEEINYGRKQEL